MIAYQIRQVLLPYMVCMGYGSRKIVWVMGFCRVMGYAIDFPAYQLGGSEKVWVPTEYGFIQIWVISESTVYITTSASLCVRMQTMRHAMRCDAV